MKKIYEKHLLTELPAGWDKTSIEKMGKTIGFAPDEHGFFAACVQHMGENVDDPQGFCAKLIDTYKGTTKWRGKKK